MFGDISGILGYPETSGDILGYLGISSDIQRYRRISEDVLGFPGISNILRKSNADHANTTPRALAWPRASQGLGPRDQGPWGCVGMFTTRCKT